MIHAKIRALSPICHGGFGPSIGNAISIRKEPIVSDSNMNLVPCISGNSLRGLARRHIFNDLFDRADLDIGSLPDKQWDLLYGALANGGHLTGRESTPTPQQLRDLRTRLPPLSIFGSALYKFLLQGRVQFGFAWPVCTETVNAGLVTTRNKCTFVAADLNSETGLVRHIERDRQDPKVTGVTPMPIVIDTLPVGTELQFEIFFCGATEIEKACVAYALNKIDSIGGKSSAGFGRVAISHDGSDSAYLKWLRNISSTELKKRLVDLAGQL